MIGGISRDVDERSIHQFMVVGQRVGKPLEFLNRDAGAIAMTTIVWVTFKLRTDCLRASGDAALSNARPKAG